MAAETLSKIIEQEAAAESTEVALGDVARGSREHGELLNRLAAARRAEGDLADAQRIFAEALAVLEPLTEPGDVERETALEGLGDAAYELRDLPTALQARSQLLDERLSTLGVNDAAVGSALHRLAKVEASAGNFEAADSLFSRARE